jgi:dihydroorotase
MTTRITIKRPDDWHLHLRDNDMMRAALPYTARVFGRAICMPNLLPPVRTSADGKAYRERILAALPKGSKFKPLITCYLTDDTDPDDVERGFRDGVFTAVKMYPANATTNSAAGVTDYKKIERVLERMEKLGMRFLIHCEEVAAGVDVFDREAVFIEQRLIPMTKKFPGLKIVHEHLSSKIGVDYVRSTGGQVGASITPYHMELTRTDWIGGGLRPYMFVMPVIKTEADRLALREAATSGDACFFLGTDTAPHPDSRKLAQVGIPGIFAAPVAIESYVKIFEEEGKLDKLEAFASLNGPKHYGLHPNADTITLEKKPWVAPVAMKVEGPEEIALCHKGGETIEWQVVEC